jgi:hypothetical protein
MLNMRINMAFHGSHANCIDAHWIDGMRPY